MTKYSERTGLWLLSGERVRCEATNTKAMRFGYPDLLVCLTDVRVSGLGDLRISHLWVSLPMTLFHQPKGERIQFHATVETYRRGDGSRDVTLRRIEALRSWEQP